MPTINLPADIAGGGAALTKTYTTTDNTVYAGLPPGVVASVDMAQPVTTPVFIGPQSGFFNYQSDDTGSVNLHRHFLAKDGVRVGTEITSKCAPLWQAYNPAVSPGSTNYNACHKPAANDTFVFFGLYYRADLDVFPYDVRLTFDGLTGAAIPSGNYVFYAVAPNYYYDAGNATFLGYLHRRFAFTIANGDVTPPDPDPGGGGLTPADCGCTYTREQPPVCSFTRDAPCQTVYTRPPCGV